MVLYADIYAKAVRRKLWNELLQMQESIDDKTLIKGSLKPHTNIGYPYEMSCYYNYNHRNMTQVRGLYPCYINVCEMETL